MLLIKLHALLYQKARCISGVCRFVAVPLTIGFFLIFFLPHSARLCWKGWTGGERFSPTHMALSFLLTSCEDQPIPSGALTANGKPWCWQKQRDAQTAMPAALESGKDPVAQSSLFCNNSSSMGLFRGLYAMGSLLCYWFNLRCLEIRGPTCPFPISLACQQLLVCGRGC